MGYCDGLINKDITTDCNNIVIGGVERQGVIFNRSDIKSIVYSDRVNVVKKIELNAGAKAYKVVIPTNQPFSGTNTTLEQGTNRNTFTSNVGLIIMDHDPDVCSNVIDSLATGEFVVILENKYKNINKTENAGDSTFQIYGTHQGLKCTALENDKYSEDTEGGYSVVLTETKAPKSAVFVYDTDIDTTKAMIDSLTAM